ncbi:expressed unknown protein [Seminavis robusta]|uniref:Uncharacterized protein n=1 Tax=Seminavis robusta TaxID=568900 RepID=A0A9N8EKK3_9STRA|nr:expressed unknown protein [Seminavis robusta]|eukprot:Sro1152_g246850.1 n/a (244) ;mRNA; r:7943-8674
MTQQSSRIRWSLANILLQCSLTIIIATLWNTPLVLGFSLHTTTTPPHKSKIPEEVVQHQLDAFRDCHVAQAFQYNSQANQELTGPWQSFATSISDKAFKPILGHAESTVLMTIAHDDADYVCCLVKVIPSHNPLPPALQQVITETRRDEGFLEEEVYDDEEDDDDDARIYNRYPPCVLYWWEVSKQFEDDEENFFYRVDSVLPDAEDLELDFMETTLFAVGDGLDEDDEDDDPSGFFFDLGIL